MKMGKEILKRKTQIARPDPRGSGKIMKNRDKISNSTARLKRVGKLVRVKIRGRVGKLQRYNNYGGKSKSRN